MLSASIFNGRWQQFDHDSRQDTALVAMPLLALLALLAPSPAGAQTTGDFEAPPVLSAKDLISETRLRGEGFRVEERVPTDGVMGTYLIETDASVLGEDAGTYQVQGRELLLIRLSEIPALIELERTSKTEAFAKAAARTAVRPLQAAGKLVTNPVTSVSGLPGGVGRLFHRAASGASHLFGRGSDPDRSALEGNGGAASRTSAVVKDALGYEEERRKLAMRLGVDPYSSNPILAEKLDEVAEVSFYGRLGVSVAISVGVPGSMVISAVNTVNTVVWDTPRGDLIVRVEDALRTMNVPRADISAFTHNPAIPLSLQVSIVEHLARLVEMPGRADVVRLLGGIQTESEVRFLNTSLRMLADYHEKSRPIAAIAAPGPLIGRDRDGALILPAPVDYVSWTEWVAGFARNPDLVAAPRRTLWISGKLSPRTTSELTSSGWKIQEERPPGQRSP